MTEITGGELLARALQAEGSSSSSAFRPRDRSAAGRAGAARDPARADSPRGGRRAHGRGSLQDDRAGSRPCSAIQAPARRTSSPGVMTALHEGVPMLAITSQHRLGLVYPSSPATFQGQDQVDLFRAGGEMGRTDPRTGGASPRSSGSLSARCGTGARPRPHRPAGPVPIRDRRGGQRPDSPSGELTGRTAPAARGEEQLAERRRACWHRPSARWSSPAAGGRPLQRRERSPGPSLVEHPRLPRDHDDGRSLGRPGRSLQLPVRLRVRRRSSPAPRLT